MEAEPLAPTVDASHGSNSVAWCHAAGPGTTEAAHGYDSATAADAAADATADATAGAAVDATEARATGVSDTVAVRCTPKR